MARALIAIAACVGLPGVAGAVCQFSNDDEIINPFEPGCGDVMLTITENDNTGNHIALGYPVPIPVASLTPVDGFRTYASLFARHQALLTDNDEVSGQVVGQTVSGRDIWAYVIGDSDTQTADGLQEGAVLVNGGIHAREWQTPEAVTGLFEALVDGKADGGFGQYLVENLTTIVVPVNNVDGFLQTQLYPDRGTAHREQPREGRMRRKNLRNPNTQAAIDADIATVADNFWGIDLNRNSSQGFGLNGGSQSSVTSLIHRGAVAESEPELAALHAAAQLGPEARLRLFSDTHSFGQEYQAPTTTNARRNAVTGQLATRMAAASLRSYTYQPDPQASGGIGTTADDFGYSLQIPAWTLELEPIRGPQDYGGLPWGHGGFVLPDREVARMRADVVRQYLLGFYRQAGPPAAIAAEIRDTTSGEVVYEATWNSTSATARTRTVSTSRALIPGTQYRLWVAFNKPMRIRNGAGLIVAYRGQTPAAGVGQVTLEIPSLTGQDLTLGTNAAWLGTPGGAPNGYLRYRDDAFAVDFTLPAAITVAASTGAVISMTVTDLAEMPLDANPATAVDWQNGSWQRYEDVLNVQGDVGGQDCSLHPFIAMQAGAAPPAADTPCRAAAASPPPPPPPPSGGGGGGGGALPPWSLLALALARLLRRRAFR
jgi:hypothetical protein